MSYSRDEVKSGVLIAASLILLLVLTTVIGKFMAGKTNPYEVRFGYICGLEVNAPVHFAGREVGKVDRIDILRGQDNPVVLKIQVSDKVSLRQDTQAFIDNLGLIGEKFFELTPGTLESPVINPGSTVIGTDPIPMHVMIRKMNLLADRMDALTVSLNPMMQRMDRLTAGHEEDLAKIIVNFEEVSANLRDMTYDLKYHPWRLVRKG